MYARARTYTRIFSFQSRFLACKHVTLRNSRAAWADGDLAPIGETLFDYKGWLWSLFRNTHTSHAHILDAHTWHASGGGRGRCPHVVARRSVLQVYCKCVASVLLLAANQPFQSESCPLSRIHASGRGRGSCHATMCCSALQYVAVCCSVLQCVEVYCSVLQCVAVCCSMLQCVAVCSSVLQCVAVCCSVSQCVAVCCSVVGAGVVVVLTLAEFACAWTYTHISVLQCVAVCWEQALKLSPFWRKMSTDISAHTQTRTLTATIAQPGAGVLVMRAGTRCETMCARLLTCVATCCSVMRCDAVCCSAGTWCETMCSGLLTCIAMCCSVMQCVAV